MESKEGQIGKKMMIWLIVIFVALPLIGRFVAGVITYTMPKLYESRALVELVPSGSDVEAWGVEQYVATEIEVMQSKQNFLETSRKIQLDVRWGMAEYYVADELPNMVKVTRLSNGRMLEVICQHRMKEESQAICMAVYEAYRDRKAKLHYESAHMDSLVIKHELRVVTNRFDGLALEYSHLTGTYKGKLSWVGEKRDVETVKKEYDVALNEKKKLELEFTQAKRIAETPIQAIIIHEVPEISHSPVSPNISFNLSMGMGLGLLAACVIDGVILLILRVKK